jgi:hypothetical protein
VYTPTQLSIPDDPSRVLGSSPGAPTEKEHIMSNADPFASEYESSEYDAGLDEEGRKYTQQRQEWLKMNKGQVIRAAFVYFHTVNKNAVEKARTEAVEKKTSITIEQASEIGRTALTTRATALTKSVDQLTPIDRLDLSEVKMKRMWFHYQDGLGYVISRLGKDGPEADAVWKKLPEPKITFTTLLLIYPTDRQGNIDKEKLASNWHIIPWRFHKGVYEGIWKLNKGLEENGTSIASQDVKLECKVQEYQNIDVQFCGPAVWQKSPKFKEVVLAKAMELYDKLIPFREMTTDQLRSKLGMGGSAVSSTGMGGDATSATDFADLLENV